MPSTLGIGLGFIIVIVILLLVGMVAIVSKFYRQVEQGRALIINKRGLEHPEVTFTGAVVLPIIHKSELMDISVKTIRIDRRGKEGLICRDNIRADIEVTFFVRVNKTAEDVLKVAQHIGCVRASDGHTLETLFTAKFAEALKTVGKQLDFVDLYTMRHEFRDQIVQVIGRDLNGFVLEDCAIDYLEQTPLVSLDRDNILDAQGIRKITELTAIEHVRTNEYSNNERKLTKKQDVEAAEAILELDRQQAEAQAKQLREIETRRAREQAETLKVQSEERLKAEMARIRSDEEIQVNEENKNRQVEVAAKNRERVVGVESEKATRDRALEAISRERDVELQRIAKDKLLEIEKKAIQDVIRERVVVERGVAEEEERIKGVRVVEEAKRMKESTIIAAEAEAQEQLVKGIRAADAAEQAAKFRARERVTLAEAELEAAEKEAQAKLRMADAIQAEAAASGLAEVKVKEADALAIEKIGRAEATVIREKGSSEGQAIEARLSGEARGLAEKAESMKALDESSRGHEEYRMRIDTERLLSLESIRARKEVAVEVATAQGKMLSEALKNAKIDIVGGDGVFFDRLVNAISAGKAVDAFVERSETTRTLLDDYLSGKQSLPDDLKEVLSRANLSGETLQSLTLSALLLKMIGKSDGDHRAKLQKLSDQARSLGLADLNLGS